MSISLRRKAARPPVARACTRATPATPSNRARDGRPRGGCSRTPRAHGRPRGRSQRCTEDAGQAVRESGDRNCADMRWSPSSFSNGGSSRSPEGRKCRDSASEVPRPLAAAVVGRGASRGSVTWRISSRRDRTAATERAGRARDAHALEDEQHVPCRRSPPGPPRICSRVRGWGAESSRRRRGAARRGGVLSSPARRCAAFQPAMGPFLTRRGRERHRLTVRRAR
jgi:hypothetical protein